jgi:hypothetical protein
MTERKSTALGKGYDTLVGGISQILEAGRSQAAWTLNSVMSAVYWEIGRRIVEFEQAGKQRADYGERVIEQLGKDLKPLWQRFWTKQSLPDPSLLSRLSKESPDTVWTFSHSALAGRHKSLSIVVVAIRPAALSKRERGARLL